MILRCTKEDDFIILLFRNEKIFISRIDLNSYSVLEKRYVDRKSCPTSSDAFLGLFRENQSQ